LSGEYSDFAAWGCATPDQTYIKIEADGVEIDSHVESFSDIMNIMEMIMKKLGLEKKKDVMNIIK